MKKIKIRILAILVYTLLFCLGSVPSFAQSPVQSSALDTIAGFSTVINSSITTPQTDLTFRVIKPNGSILNLYSQTDISGTATTEFNGYHSKQSGIYKIYTYPTSGQIPSLYTSFKVFPDNLSLVNSTLNSNKLSINADGIDSSYITVQLQDKYHNPIPNHQLTLLSSRSTDTIESQSNRTDNNGTMVFKISSHTPGISTFIATDITTNSTIDKRLEMIFLNNNSFGQGGNDLLLADLIAQDNSSSNTSSSENDELFGELDHFEIEIASQVILNEETNILVYAKDINNKTVKDYTGTIRFAVSTDENVILPSDYIFTENDQGQKIFSLAIRFSRLGTHNIEVIDINDFSKKGTSTINVVQSNYDPNNQETSELTILSPDNGLTTSQTILIISGEGGSNIGVKIFDNNIPIGTSNTDSDGKFSFSAKNLSEGEHIFYALEDTESSGQKSNEVVVTIDISAPVVESFELTPDGPIKVGSNYTVKVRSESNLDEVSMMINGIKEILIENEFQLGLYEANLVAPDQVGDFELPITLVDSFQNRTTIDPQQILQTYEEKLNPPPVIQNLQAVAAQKEITLTWNKITNHERALKNYRLYYGTNSKNLNNQIDLPVNNDHYNLTNLENNTTYYFEITAIDESDLESLSRSIQAQATPLTPSITLNAVASDTTVTLNWDSLTNLQIAKYKIYYGIESRKYSDIILTNDNKTTYSISDLQNNQSYYFLVAPLDSNGNELKIYSNEVEAKPASLTPIDKPSTLLVISQPPIPIVPTDPNYIQQQHILRDDGEGPGMTWLIILSFLFVGVIQYISTKLFL